MYYYEPILSTTLLVCKDVSHSMLEILNTGYFLILLHCFTDSCLLPHEYEQHSLLRPTMIPFFLLIITI
jgi:hypothetical protein